MDVPGEPVENAPCRRSFEKAHWRAEDGIRHPLMQFATGLCFALALRTAALRARMNVPQ